MKKNINRPFIFIIYGPTGVGKTELALELARYISAEIINMDVGQFYTPLSIGTAKPDWRNSSTPHHLFDIIDTPINYSVTEYRDIAYKTASAISQRGNLPIFVGGSGFYLYSLLFSYPHFFNPDVLSSEKPLERTFKLDQDIWQELYQIDPIRAQNINKNDTYRIQRALDIWYHTGKLPSSYTITYTPEADYLVLWVERDREELKNRINERVAEMMDNGWIDEAQKLCNTPWESFLRKKNLIGYSEIFNYLNGKKNQSDFDAMIALISNQTRQYAKRQFTFWRKLEREIKKEKKYTSSSIGCLETVNLTHKKISIYIRELAQRLVHLKEKS